MDKKSLIGLGIIGLILLAFTLYNSKQQQELMMQQAKADSTARTEALVAAATAPTVQQPVIDSASGAVAQPALGAAADDSTRAQHLGEMLFTAQQGEQKLYTVENEVMKLTLSNKGGEVTGVELKDYKTYKGEPLQLFAPNSAKFDLSLFIKRNFSDAQINTGEYYFTTEQPMQTTLSDGVEKQQVSMKLNIDSTSYIEYLYTIYKDSYMIDFQINFKDMAGVVSNQSNMLITWENVGPQNEKGFENENNYTTISYMYPGTDELESLGMSKEEKEEDVKNKVHWVAFKQQFFSSVFIADKSFENSLLKYTTFAPTDDNIKTFTARLAVPFSPQTSSYDFQFYFGPNKYSTLNKFDIGMEKLVPLGGWVIGWVNRWLVIPLFDFLGKYIANYGIIILILTIIIKIVISPLTYKSYLSTAKMRLLKPEMDEIAARYPKQDEAMKKQQAVMELYKKAGVSPMGGCIPLLIQFPILIAMFRFFPASIELRGEHFLWADDLSSYDSILNLPFDIPFYGAHVSLFALLMAASLYVSSKINYTQTAQAGPQMAGMKFMMLYMMPVMMLFWFNNYSSGLSYYYLLSNIITIGQTYGFRYIVNDKKLHAQMKQNATKPRKKSKWAAKYEQMVKAQQQQQQQLAKKKK